jgi:hypothetical protein
MRVFFHPSLEGVSLFAAPTVCDSGNNSMSAVLSTWLDAEQKPINSEASLDGVKEVVICKDKAKILGLLLRYTDGKQASVGSFRLDRVEAPLSVSGSSCLYIGSRLSDAGESVVEAISLSNLGHDETL